MHTVVAIVRDEPCLEQIRAVLGPAGIQVLAAHTMETGVEQVRRSCPHVILVDEGVAGAESLLRGFANSDPGAEVLLLTDRYSPESAVEAIGWGARDCLNKRTIADNLAERVVAILNEPQQRRATPGPDEQALERFRFHGMAGRSPGMLELFARIRRVAPHYRIALISGATGTGKELVAHALHELSPVSNRRFAVCNCSAIVETLFESELFGHVRGAFTGATQDRAGLFEYAQGGTVFLDEIADMPVTTQSKLLRVIQNQELQRVGSPEVRKVDVRVIAATNRDMRALVAQNLFREDLYYRLGMVELKLPRLADRKEDLPLLERHFVEHFSRSYGKAIRGISQRAEAALARHTWPGNVRELENVLGHACMMADGEFVDLRDLPDYFQSGITSAAAGEPDLVSLADLEQRYTQHVLGRLGGNKLQAAQVLGISRATLYRILRDSSPAGPEPGVDFLAQTSSAARMRVQ